MILLSPEEEDEIAGRLAGAGWYRAVGEILATEGSPKVIPTTDWRYQWVQDTLRRLESTIPILSREPELCPNWAERPTPDCPPMPPPAEHPLRPAPARVRVPALGVQPHVQGRAPAARAAARRWRAVRAAPHRQARRLERLLVRLRPGRRQRHRRVQRLPRRYLRERAGAVRCAAAGAVVAVEPPLRRGPACAATAGAYAPSRRQSWRSCSRTRWRICSWRTTWRACRL